MENNKIYKIFFDYIEIELDSRGDITNDNDCYYIAEYEWEEETETEKFIRRVNFKNVEIPMDITVEEMEDLDYIDDYFDTPQKAYDALDDYLDNYKAWHTISGGYWQPDEYICVGLEPR